MSALTTIFNYLFSYLIVFLSCVFGIEIDNFSALSPELQKTVNLVVESVFSHITEEQLDTFFHLRPVLFLSIGIFACGSIIGLVRRLIR